MKLIKYSVLSLALISLASCGGVSDRHEEIQKLNDVSGEWTKEQTDQAIDIYIEGQKEMIDNAEDIGLIMEKQFFFSESKCDEDALKERKDEIKEAKQRLQDVEKELEKKYEKKD